MWWLAMMPEGFSTGFTSSAMLLRHFLFLMKSVPEHQLFTKTGVALLKSHAGVNRGSRRRSACLGQR